MGQSVTVTFKDGTQHVYQNAPDNLTPDMVEARAMKDFGKPVADLSRGAPLAATGSSANGAVTASIGGDDAPLPPSTPLQDAAAGFVAPFQKLGHDVMTQIRAGPRPIPTNLGDLAKNVGANMMAPVQIGADIAALPSAISNIVVHPLANALARYGPAPTAPPHLTAQLSIAPAQKLQGRQAAQYIEGQMNTALAGARPTGNPLAAALAKTTPTPAPTPPALEAPSIAELRSQSSALYDAARNAGVVVKPEAFQQFATDLEANLASEGIDPTLQPRTTAALNRIANTSGPVDLQQLDNLRKIASSAASTPDKSDQRLARMVTDHIDDFVGNLKPADVLSGDPQAASDMLGQARDLWSRQAKAQQIEDLITKAKNNASGTVNLDSSLRTQFKNLLNNPRGMARFNPEEQDAIRKVALGSPLDQTLFQLGKFAPSSPLMAMMELGVGSVAHPALALPAVGMASKMASNANAARNAALASALMRRGGPP